MATDHSNGPPVVVAPEGGPNDNTNEYVRSDSRHADGSWQNGAPQAPIPTIAGSNSPLPPSGWAEDPTNGSDANRPRPRNGRSTSAQTRVCKKCGLQLTGQFVRALDGTFHLDCFKCRVMQRPLSFIPFLIPPTLPRLYREMY